MYWKVFVGLKCHGANVKDSFIVESLAFVNSCVQKVNFIVRDFSREFYCKVVSVCKDNKIVYLLLISTP